MPTKKPRSTPIIVTNSRLEGVNAVVVHNNVNVKQRLVVTFVLVVGLALCLVNVLCIVHMVEIVHHNHHEDDEAASNNSKNEITSMMMMMMTTTTTRHRRNAQQVRLSDEANSDNPTQQDAPAGKERLLEILREAGIQRSSISQASVEQLPTWEQVVNLYGNEPKIVGLETCATFRDSIPASERLLGVAGVFNSGTNLLAEQLIHNCVIQERLQNKKKKKNRRAAAAAAGGGGGGGIRWQVNWGKHTPARFRLAHYIDTSIRDNTVILPVVSMRHAYSWMQSMCRNRYSAHWFHAPGHCPNLIPNQVDYEFYPYASTYRHDKRRFLPYHANDPWLIDNVENTAGFTLESPVVPLYVRYKLQNVSHTSLAHFWNDWYDEYINADFPRVIVRMEDLVFHGKQVTQRVCECVGGTFNSQNFTYVTDSAKKGGDNIHGKDRTTLLDAMIQYGHNDGWTRGMTQDDVTYARSVFRQDFMDMFGYHHPK